jgi:MFS family permease
VIWSLLAMRVAPPQPYLAPKGAFQELAEGWNYVAQSPAIRSILLLLALISIVGMPAIVLMPVVAADILHGGAHTLGFLMAMSGVGALASAIDLVLRKSVRGLGKRIAISVGLFGVGMVVLGLSKSLTISLALMAVIGFGMMQQMAASNTIIQTIVEDDKRGRVMSFYAMAFVGMAPFGSLLAGISAHAMGAPLTVMLSGACCLAGAIWFATQVRAIRKLIRPIYVDLGILPAANAVIRDSVGG